MIRASILFLICVPVFISCKQHAARNTEQSWNLLPFVKADSANPVLLPDSTTVFDCPIAGPLKWEAKDVFNPAAVVRHDTVFLLYRAEDKVGKFAGTSRIGLAYSMDGLHFTRTGPPVLYPANDPWKKYEWEGGCEDPRVIIDDQGVYHMYYTAYDGDKARLMAASSSDLFHWIKTGLAFDTAYGGKYVDTWGKSGSVVCRYTNGEPVAVKSGGYYWMYWGDTNIFLAKSTDLVHWMPVENADGTLYIAFGPRKGMFDSDLVEPGPPAMLTDKGILLFYNGRNVPAHGDTTLKEGTYAASQILFDSASPGHMLQRMDRYFMKPEKIYEITGQVNQVCFIEGLVRFKGKWILYYGTADSKIAAATCDNP
jgi:predicted GH43/DUF377 family glycosyl hydrolase